MMHIHSSSQNVPPPQNEGSFLQIETWKTIFEKNYQTKIFSMLLENFLATFFCCSNKKQQICWQVKIWGVVVFCRSNKFFSPKFSSTSCWRAHEKFLARAHSNTSKFTPENAKKLRFTRFFDRNSEVLKCAHAKNFSRARQHDVEENFDEKILLLRQNATTSHIFTYQQICCFLLLQQKNVAKKFSNNIEKFLVW